ncbi:hypothetical protein BKA70DRAFT_1472426 [Coprinopsis sp. MPI-PUGE-AT-0042]|nr:hypothetical protein BKA70DRAFT_1472426 [Coprinopsis sp. MPI-PUGE-AT-0042]
MPGYRPLTQARRIAGFRGAKSTQAVDASRKRGKGFRVCRDAVRLTPSNFIHLVGGSRAEIRDLHRTIPRIFLNTKRNAILLLSSLTPPPTHDQLLSHYVTARMEPNHSSPPSPHTWVLTLPGFTFGYSLSRCTVGSHWTTQLLQACFKWLVGPSQVKGQISSTANSLISARTSTRSLPSNTTNGVHASHLIFGLHPILIT